MSHADPESSIVVRRPVALRDWDRRKVCVEEGTPTDLAQNFWLKFNATVWVFDCFSVCQLF
jgi:hypothetical protein